MWGYGVEEEQLFTRVMEVESTTGLEVVNLGVSGYGNGQELLLWRLLGARFAPDDVILFIYPENDLYDNVATVRYGYPKPRVVKEADGRFMATNTPVPKVGMGEITESVDQAAPYLRRQAARSGLVSSTLLAGARIDWFRRVLEENEIIGKRKAGYGEEASLFMESLDAKTDMLFQEMGGLISAIRDEVEQAGASLRLVVVPQPFQVYPELWEEFIDRHPIADERRWNRDAPQERIRRIGASLSVPVVDLLSVLRKRGESDPYLYYPWNQHWTAGGHAAVADVLLGELAARR